ncbi:questin oxidase family protein [Salininema proteolyticum]|uniref:Questin oxidase family protein n=1 Tax=Salininema proteolyticum TaxID=1607685 RepID=A0ABV8U0V7_9ACTN
MESGRLDALYEAWTRLHSTGPEFNDWLSNHGPMAAEALVRHGYADRIPAWLDSYSQRLEESPRGIHPVTADNWQEALGDPRRLGDWPDFFRRELAEAPWEDVLAAWWPRLLPGIAAGATHGVIRVGHAVRIAREAGANEVTLEELAQALAYWAARWQPVVDPRTPRGEAELLDALKAVGPIKHREHGILTRLEQLEETPTWRTDQEAAAPAADPEEFLRRLVSAAVEYYRTRGNGNPVMLVHAATAPNAVLRSLPSLPRELWRPSAEAAWTASAALAAIYQPDEPVPEERQREFASVASGMDEAIAEATTTGEEHAIKFADTAASVLEWDPGASSAAATVSCAVMIKND